LLEVDEYKDLYLVISDFGVSTVIDDSLFKVKGMPKSLVSGASCPYAAPEVFQRLRRNPSAECGKIDTVELLKAAGITGQRY
jgi:hypothetical protein